MKLRQYLRNFWAHFRTGSRVTKLYVESDTSSLKEFVQPELEQLHRREGESEDAWLKRSAQGLTRIESETLRR